MDDPNRQSDNMVDLPQIRHAPRPTIADEVFDALQKRILTLELPPETRISETEVAQKMGVSRQPVREAFKRLAKLGFLLIRPQSSTTVTLISEEAVLRARYVRTALEVHTCRTACKTLSEAGLENLAALIEEQKGAIAAEDKDRFHALDDAFHKELCNQTGVDYVWDLIHESKAHMDRIRMLSLTSSSQQTALLEHIEIHKALTARDPDAAAETMTNHLSRILGLIEDVKAQNHNWFTFKAR